MVDKYGANTSFYAATVYVLFYCGTDFVCASAACWVAESLLVNHVLSAISIGNRCAAYLIEGYDK